jgi:hypothetical protein
MTFLESYRLAEHARDIIAQKSASRTYLLQAQKNHFPLPTNTDFAERIAAQVKACDVSIYEAQAALERATDNWGFL